MEDLITHVDDESAAVVRFGPVLYVVWRAPDTANPIPYCDEAVEALLMRYGRGRNLYYVHRAPEAGSFGKHDTTREAVMKHFDRTEPYFRAAALAIEATGFAGAVVRSVTAGVMLMRRSQVKAKVFDDARLGVRWLASMTAPGSGSFDPNAMIRELRSRELCRTLGFEQDFAT
jgi:hypothetical protein